MSIGIEGRKNPSSTGLHGPVRIETRGTRSRGECDFEEKASSTDDTTVTDDADTSRQRSLHEERARCRKRCSVLG